MLSGPQLLQSFDERLARAEGEAAAAQAEAGRIAARVETLRAAEAQAMEELARLHLGELGEAGGAALGRLEAARARARDLLNGRAGGAAAAEAEVAERRRAVNEARAARDREVERLGEAEAAAARAAAAAREALSADPEWLRLGEAAAAAARVAGHAAQKAEFARADRDAKGQPYLADPLFRYLWERGFGTARYRAGGLTRFLDRFVARVARFDAARRDYVLLTELPERLAAHAERMREVAAERGNALAAYERRATTEPGGTALAEARAALRRSEDALEAAHAALAEAEGRRIALSDDDAARREAMAVLKAALEEESLLGLRQAAARTPMMQDDVIVARIGHATAERASLEPQLAQRRAESKNAAERVQQLLALRREMRERRVETSHWNFGDGALLGMLLGQVLGGSLSRGGFWDRVEESRVPSGGPWGGGPWSGDAPSGPWGSGPWGGGFGDASGGFSTGGSFGGGDGQFRTGGSF